MFRATISFRKGKNIFCLNIKMFIHNIKKNNIGVEKLVEKQNETIKDLTIDEIIDMLANIRVDLDELRKIMSLQKVNEFLEDIILRIDVIGCELTQNISKKLKEK
jgi:hypothetical protein